MNKTFIIFILIFLGSTLVYGSELYTIDYTHGKQLAYVPGAEKGYYIHHLQLKNNYPHWLARTREQLAALPVGSNVAYDWEPWIDNEREFPWYGDASDDENREMLTLYKRFLDDTSDLIKERELSLGIYGVPVLMQRNWNSTKTGYEHAKRGEWERNQTRLIVLAEETQFLPTLRELGGHVQVVGYLPSAWNEPRWADSIQHCLATVDRKLDAYNVPHRWLFKSYTDKALCPEVLQVLVDRGGDWWGVLDKPGYDELRAAMRTNP